MTEPPIRLELMTYGLTKKIEVEKLSKTHPRVRLKIDPTTERDLRIKRCNESGALAEILRHNGIEFVGNASGTFAANYPCPKCGVTTFTVTGLPAMRLQAGHYRTTNSKPTMLKCDSCADLSGRDSVQRAQPDHHLL